MEQLVFERPREKLQSRGAAYLTTVELVQLIIGSGTARVSGARLAKRITSSFDTGHITLLKLQEIDGLGPAKASQIIAALELGRRLTQAHRLGGIPFDTQKARRAIGRSRQLTIISYIFDGSLRQIAEVLYPIKDEGPIILAQRVAKNALENNARSVIIVLGSKNDTLQTTTLELGIIKHLKESLNVLSIKIEKVYRANDRKIEGWADL